MATLAPLATVDTRGLFRPVSGGLVTLLRGLSPADWDRPTVAGAWLVRDVVAHLLDSTLRRLSFHRDGMPPPPPGLPINSERDFVAFINQLNAQWVASSKRLSPRVLTDLYERAGSEAADWFEAQPLDGPALFGVSWAGERASTNWFDIGREFTELWHHQEQIRTGPSGGQWTLVREADKWTLAEGVPESETGRITLDETAAWKLLFNALPETELAQAVRVDGRTELVAALLRARSVIV